MSSDSDDPVIDQPDEEGGDDLFGDGGSGGSGDEAISQADEELAFKERKLAEDRTDDYRMIDGGYDDEFDVREKVVMSIPMYRHRIPKSKDGQVSYSSDVSAPSQPEDRCY